MTCQKYGNSSCYKEQQDISAGSQMDYKKQMPPAFLYEEICYFIIMMTELMHNALKEGFHSIKERMVPGMHAIINFMSECAPQQLISN